MQGWAKAGPNCTWSIKMLNEGDLAPDVTLQTADGGSIKLSQMLNHNRVL